LLGHIKPAWASVSGQAAPAPCGYSVGGAGSSVGEVGLTAKSLSRKNFRGAQRHCEQWISFHLRSLCTP